MNNHIPIYSSDDVDRIITTTVAGYKEGALTGLCAASLSGAIMGWIANSLFHLAGWL